MERLEVWIVYSSKRNQFLIRWKCPETRKTKERRSTAKRRDLAEREAAELRRELESKLPDTDWEDFKARYEREHCSGKRRYNWRAITARIEQVKPIRVLADIDASVISQAIALMREEGRPSTTIQGYLKHLRAGLGWAKSLGLIRDVPAIRMPKVKRQQQMRSRPITGEEFDRLLAAVPKAKRNPEPWVRLLNVLYWGGLRIGEAAILTMDWTGEFAIMLDHDPPIFRIQASGQKSRQDELLPVAPELVEYLETLGDLPKRGRLLRDLPSNAQSLVKGVAQIGEASGIVVNSDGKTVTSHDLRRSFGTRWAKRLTAADLHKLMRHEDIQTTLTYYVDVDSKELGKRLWESVEGQKQAIKLSKTD